MAISRRDLPHILQALDALFRILENSSSKLSDFAVPAVWNPTAPSTWLPNEPVAENWVRAQW